MALSAPDASLVARFRADLERLAPGAARIGLAVSGGPDSLALLLLGAAAAPDQVEAATVDHKLRAASATEAQFVAAVCAQLGVPHAILTAEVDSRRASLQQTAREARYLSLARWLDERRIPVLATAHHVDDQAETLVMRLLRGAGVSGLSSIRARARVPAPHSGADLVRPLLGWRRQELADVVRDCGLEAVDDPSNRDPRHDRVRIRGLLAETAWLEPVPLARSATALAEADEALGWTADALFDARVTKVGSGFDLDSRDLPAELKRRVVLAILARLRPAASPPRGDELGRLIAALEQGKTATLAEVKAKGGSRWHFERAPARRRSG